MHRLGRLLVAALLLGAFPATATAVPLGPALTFPPAPAETVPGELVVGFTDGASAATRAAARGAVDGDLTRKLGDPDVQLLDVGDATDVESAAAALERRPGVAYAEPNYVGYVAAGPNDARYAEQSALTRIAAEKAWDYTTGSTAVRVAILDTGIDRTHPDLSATGAQDTQGHGTKVAGIAAARGNNGAGIAGVAWRSDLRSYAACDAQGVCTTSAQVAAINAAKADGAKVANMSIDSTGAVASQAVFDAIAGSNMLVVAAAGNGTAAAGAGRDIDAAGNASYPCSYALANVICVGATRATSDTAYQYTNYGATSVDLYAPGSGVLTTTQGGGYATSSGTSEAAPHVTGAAALLWATDPTLSIAEVRDVLEDSTDQIVGLPPAAHGRLNVLRALASLDETAPTVTLATAVSGSTATATFSASEPNVAFDCRIDDSPSWTPGCTSPMSYPGLAAGSHTIEVRGTDPGGNVGTASKTAGVRPTTTVTNRPPAAQQSPDATVEWTVDEPGASTQCRLDGGTWDVCTSPWTATGLAEGTHTLSLRSIGPGGTEVPVKSVTWKVDTIPPAVTISSPAGGEVVHRRDVDVVFGAEDAVSYVCKVDGGPAAPCTSPLPRRNLADTPPAGAPYSIEVVATDAAGNVGPPAAVEWTVDASSPSLDLSGPPPLTSNPDATFTFNASPDATDVSCTLDGTPVTPCTSPLALRAGDGQHTFVVSAKGANTTPTTATWTWRVDTVKPVVTMTGGPTAYATTTTSAFTWTASETGTTFACTVDDAEPVSCASGFTTSSALGQGEHSLTITPTDAAGNVGDPVTRIWTKDTVAPPATLATLPDQPTGAPDKPTFAFSSTDGTATFECSLDSTTAFTACTSPKSYEHVDAGTHTFRVRAVDPAGNKTPVTTTPTTNASTRTWTVALAAPRPSITGPAGPYGSAAASFSFAAAGATAYECRLDNATEWTTGCTSPAVYAGLAEGPHTFQVRAADPNLSDPSSQTFTVDTLAPGLAITAAPEGTQPAGDATIAFTTEAGAAVTCRVDGGVTNPCSSPLTLSRLDNGGHTVTLRSTDAAGNASTASVGWTVQLPVVPQPTVTPTVVPTVTPTAVPTAVPTALPTPAPTPEPASTTTLTKTVAKRFAKKSGRAAAKVKRFTVTYRATLAGKLAVRVELRVGRAYKPVAGGSATYTRASSRRLGISVSKTGAKLLRKAGAKPKLRVRAAFTPVG